MDATRKICMVIDESGGSGYTRHRQFRPEEFGLLAGYMVPDDRLQVLRHELTGLTNQFTFPGKTHVSDLPPEERTRLSAAIFEHFQKRNLMLFYHGEYLTHHQKFQQIFDDAVQGAKDLTRGRYELPYHFKNDQFHAWLFDSMLQKAIHYCKHFVAPIFELRVIFDTISKGLLRKMRNVAQDLVNLSRAKVESVNAFDKLKQEKVSRPFCVHDQVMQTYYSGFGISVEYEDSPLTLAADAFASSLRLHVESVINELGCVNLEQKDTLSGHPLSDRIYGLRL